MPHRRGQSPSRDLVTVLFTDIVGSTELAASLGDRRWRQLLDRHNSLIRRELRKFRGHEVDTAGDGVFATFDRPAQAIECAATLVERLAELDIPIRAGLHMGEVEHIGPKVGGMAVHIGARIAAIAGPGEILVSRTVKDLVTGSDLGFEERGNHELKGVPGTWDLYELDRTTIHVEAPEPTPAPEPGASRGRRRGLIAAGIVVALGVAALAFFLVGGGDSSPKVPGVNMVGRLDVESSEFEQAVAVGRRPTGVTEEAGDIWVLNYLDQTVSQIDQTTGEVSSTRSVGGPPTAITSGGDAVWIAAGFGLSSGGEGSILRLDPASGQIGAPITVGSGVEGIAYGEGSVWVTSKSANNVTRIDPSTGGILSTIEVGEAPLGITVGEGAVWVANSLGQSVSRIDVATDEVTDTIPVGDDPTAITTSDDAVWVVSTTGNTVTRIDPADRHIEATVEVPSGPTSISAGVDSVWVSATVAGLIVSIDPETGSVGQDITVDGSPDGLVATDEGVWVAVRPL